MKSIHILCFCFGIFIYTAPTQTGEGLLAGLGKGLAKAGEKDLLTVAEKNAAKWGERFNMAFDMGMPMGVGMAASQANQFLSEEQAAVFADFQSEISAINDGLTSWSASQIALTKEQMNTVHQYFSTQLTTISDSQTNIQKTAQAESNYLFQNLSLAQPASSLVSFFAAGALDQYFAEGIMATPASNFTWYNYQVTGDWLFDPISNSFWQNQAIPFSSKDNPFDIKKLNPTIINTASLNSIFAEYYPSQRPYTIQGSFTLYAVTYPYFAGIMINKNRWISGDIESQNKCRLLGIYATSISDAGIYFAEQYEISNKDATAENASNPTPIKIPLLQIMNGHVKSLASISEQTLKNIDSEPVTFNFTITTNPTSVSFKLWAATETEPAKEFLIQNLNSSFYLYHTLGFISPGVATEWKLTAPKELTFSPQAIINFKNKVFPPKN